MKNKIMKKLFLTLMGLAGVFVFTTSNINIDPIPSKAEAQQEVVNPIQTFETSFGPFPGKYYRNYNTNIEAFPSILCTGYRYSRLRGSNVFQLHPLTYSGRIKITEIEPLPGMFSNQTPIKGMTKVSIRFTGTGELVCSSRVDFRSKEVFPLTQNAPDSTFEITFRKGFYPAYFRVQTTTDSLSLFNMKITRNLQLGVVNNNLCPSGHYTPHKFRFRTPAPDATSMPIDLDVYYKVSENKNYIASETYNTLTDAVNQIALYGTNAKTLSINNTEGYNRNDGYVKTFGDLYIQSQTYYEFDVPLGDSDGRGTGRLVYFTKGVNAKGYENQPLIVFTDDHYLTFCEFMNFSNDHKAVFSPRFNASSLLTGYKWTPSKTFDVDNSAYDTIDDIERDIRILPDGIMFLDINETVKTSYILNDVEGVKKVEYIVFNYPYEKNKPVVVMDEANEIFTCKNYGHADVHINVSLPPIYPWYDDFKTSSKNSIEVYVGKLINMTLAGDCNKTYYDGEKFDPTGLTVTGKYLYVNQNENGRSNPIDVNKCQWLNPLTRDVYMTKGQTSILCVYKDIEVEIKGITVLDSPKIQRIEISEPEGNILINKPIQLTANTFPEHSNNAVKWHLNCKNDAATLTQDGLLTPLKANNYIQVTAESIKEGIKTTSYYKIVNEMQYKPLINDSVYHMKLDPGEYIIAACVTDKENNNPKGSGTTNSKQDIYYAYDPSLPGNIKTTPLYTNDKGVLVNPNVGCKIKFIQSPQGDEHYYLQRTDNNLYLDLTSSTASLNDSSLTPVDHYVKRGYKNVTIYNQDQTSEFLFNEDWMSFGQYKLSSQISLTFFDCNHRSNGYSSTDGFVNLYMHLDDYTENLNWCKDNEHHYYLDARKAFQELDKSERRYFSTNANYATAWARLNSWARNNNEEIIIDSEGNVTFNVLNSKMVDIQQDNTLNIITCVTLLSSLSFIAFILIKRKQIED